MTIKYDSTKRVYFKYGSDAEEKWTASVIERIQPQVVALSNEDLYDEYTTFAGGDDYDGCHSQEGLIVWYELRDELDRRLKKIGFLPKDENSSN